MIEYLLLFSNISQFTLYSCSVAFSALIMGDPDFVETKIAELLMTLERWTEAQTAYKEMLKTR